MNRALDPRQVPSAIRRCLPGRRRPDECPGDFLFRGMVAGVLVALRWTTASAEAVWNEPAVPSAIASDEQSAAERYVANLRALLTTRIVPAVRRGIVAKATSRPPALTVEVIDDPSPYNLAVKTAPDGSLSVRLSIGYLTLHDAALDAVVLSAVLQRPQQLHEYLRYQWLLARQNEESRARHARARRAMTFAEFIGLGDEFMEAVYAQADWRHSRQSVEADSLGWTIAYLLVRADPMLAGVTSQPIAGYGPAAARLAAASGWFPVPPFATALGLAEIFGSATAAPENVAMLCSVAQLMEDGIGALHADAQWSSLLREDAGLQRRIAETWLQIARMRHDAGCASAFVAVERISGRVAGRATGTDGTPWRV